MTKTPRLLWILAPLALLAAACGGSAASSGDDAAAPDAAVSSSGDAAAAGGAAVTVEHIAFTPNRIEVPAGTEVVWTSRDADVKHTVTSGIAGDNGVPGIREPKPNEPDGRFDGVLADAGATFTHRFDEAGSYSYFCIVHPSMTAEVVVS